MYINLMHDALIITTVICRDKDDWLVLGRGLSKSDFLSFSHLKHILHKHCQLYGCCTEILFSPTMSRSIYIYSLEDESTLACVTQVGKDGEK